MTNLVIYVVPFHSLSLDASWQWYDRDGLAAPINMDFSKITRANFAFFQITEEGEIYGTDSWADPITLFGPYDWMAEDGFQYCSWDEPGAPPKCGYHFYNEGLIYLSHQAGTEVVSFMFRVHLCVVV